MTLLKKKTKTKTSPTNFLCTFYQVKTLSSVYVRYRNQVFDITFYYNYTIISSKQNTSDHKNQVTKLAGRG